MWYRNWIKYYAAIENAGYQELFPTYIEMLMMSCKVFYKARYKIEKKDIKLHTLKNLFV